MAKEKLAVASSEPVSLDETSVKNTTTEATKTTDKKKSSEITGDKKLDNTETKTENSAADDELEEVAVDETDGKKTSDKPGKPRVSKEKEPSKADTPSPKQSTKDSEKNDPSTDSKATSETKSAGSSADADAPPRPARPVSPLAQMKRDLKEAFPQTEDKYIEAFLIASEGRVDPAFNALLYLLDPSFKPEPVVVKAKPTSKDEKSVYTDDELLARQLQKEFDREERKRRSAAAKSRQKTERAPVEEDDESPDEIEQLKEQFSQGFEEAKSTINGWVSGLAKKFSQDEESGSSSSRLNLNPKLFGALGGSSFNSAKKNNGRKFDEDPEILSLDFSRRVDLKENDPPKLPTRSGKKEQESRWQPLNSDVPVSSDAFLVTDLEEEDKK